MSGAAFIGTSNRGFAQQAQEEIRRLVEAPVAFQWLVPNEIFMFTFSTIGNQEAIDKLQERQPVFLRHMQPVDIERDWQGSDREALQWIGDRLGAAGESWAGVRMAVQIRKAEQYTGECSPSELKQELDRVLDSDFAAIPVVKEADRILSVFLTDGKLFAGVSKPQDNLSDWSGGAIRFRREDGQISRAKFKLLEAEAAFGLDFAQYRSALDIGAAPGGWTSLLLERGLHVTAVDPAKLDPTLLRDPKLTWLQKNAGDVTFASGAFDLLVCDMSWGHRQMAKLVKGLLYALQPGGTAVITVKLMHKKAFQSLREAIQDLSPGLELQQAKQLFHNRDELTLFMIRSEQ
ncbi:SAM-dependent methyltransferase [Paenibacillus allorhizosphaerae]|uniref:Ribosomal RNA large subunit methyltransferase M n=1 Tax=Paenibacillus allorhizosphaerae TaxID=2849866 RepID=A0ABM8VL68_9BACL|nr:FtsJ-like methyltransferase family protein [Paenibacillus allorhizosphaerae]CAG7648202.1 Ribosomal RNA large subunit methyltransferase M [Paenibacillus allorhizosphaerae]